MIHTERVRELLAEPRLANLRRQAEIFEAIPSCGEVAQHPRDGLRPCLTVLNSSGACVNTHRHVEAR